MTSRKENLEELSTSSQYDPPNYKSLFWLHIKKSGGTTVRSLMGKHYKQVDRTKKPGNFIQSSKEDHNDMLNNYRILLGDYQFKRAIFAKTYLYRETWQNSIYSFAFSREPTERCLSMFSYLYWRKSSTFNLILNYLLKSYRQKKLIINKRYAFDAFLDCIESCKHSESVFNPISLSFTTHTNSMYNDITDFEGNVIIDDIFKIENIEMGVNKAFEECGINDSVKMTSRKLNSSNSKDLYYPKMYQINKIEELYKEDYTIYKNAK